VKNKQFSGLSAARSGRPPIRTSFIDLLKVITRLTKDDELVLEIVKRIFKSHSVRLTRTLAPVRLVNGRLSPRAARRTKFTRNSAWDNI
jgi:hypothetical protein